MAIVFRGWGTFASGTTAATAPAATGAVGTDLRVAFICSKPFDSLPSSSTYTDWTLPRLFDVYGAIATGNGVGSPRVCAFKSSTTTVASFVADVQGGSPTMARQFAVYSDTGSLESPVGSGGFDDTLGADVAISGTLSEGFQNGDLVVFALASGDDAHTVSSIGVTVGGFAQTVTVEAKNSTTSGNDGLAYFGRFTVSSITGTVTNWHVSGTSSNTTTARFTAGVVRIREAASTTPVSRTLSTSWHVVGRATKALSTTWNVAENLTPVSKVLATTWNVRALASDALATSWNVASTVADTLVTSWHVRSTVSASRSTLWNVWNTVSPKTLATSWHVRSAVTAARSTLWNVAGRITAARSTLWNVAATVTPKTLSTTWNVAALVTASRSTLWHVYAPVAKALETTWNVLAVGLTPVSNALVTSWHVVGRVAKATSTLWNVRAQVAASRSTTWNVRSLVAASRSTLWHVRSLVASTRSTLWHVRALVSGSRSTTWNVRSLVAASRSTLWNVRSLAAAALATSWNVAGVGLTQVSRALATTWHARSTATSARTLLWNVAARTSRAFSFVWNVQTPSVDITVNGASHILTSQQPTLTITHVIAQVNGTYHGVVAEEPVLVQNSTLTVDGTSHWFESTQVALEQWTEGWLFTTPYEGMLAFHADRLVVRLGVPGGVTILVSGSTVSEVQFPTTDQVAAADAAYMGGHEYVLDAEAAQLLTAAGYGTYLSPISVLQEA